MTSADHLAKPDHSSIYRTTFMIMIFIAVIIAGLTYVKWWPYYHKALKAITDHTIGSSILTGSESGTLSLRGALEYAEKYFKAIWKAALLGILLGSLVQVLLPHHWLQRVLGKSSFRNTFIGGMVSLPGMMCSCCAAPIAAGMRRRNVSIGASLAFWIGNPVLNPATLIFMTFVLSWKFTLVRVVFGLLLTFGVSYLANRLADKHTTVNAIAPELSEQMVEDSRPFLLRWMKSIGLLFIQIVPAYLITVLILGLFQGWMFPVSMDSGLVAIVIFAIAGTLFVIPTAAEIPIIVSFLALGVGAGPTTALLLTLPAVSLPSLLMVRRSFSNRIIWFVGVSVIACGILSGITGMLLL